MAIHLLSWVGPSSEGGDDCTGKPYLPETKENHMTLLVKFDEMNIIWIWNISAAKYLAGNQEVHKILPWSLETLFAMIPNIIRSISEASEAEL
jgi:hypothetical protein